MPQDNILDARELPNYEIAESARYLRVPRSTLRYWIQGKSYPTQDGPTVSAPLIDIADKEQCLLSFLDLVEAYVLSAIRQKHRIPLPHVRRALDYLLEHSPSQHPLADHQFAAFGKELFVEKLSELINLSQPGQLAMKQLLDQYLHRIERNPEGVPLRFFPFDSPRLLETSKTVVIDADISFGRPVLISTGLRTDLIMERFWAGDTMKELADDYGILPEQIEQAIRWESDKQAAVCREVHGEGEESQNMNQSITGADVERVARIYNDNQDTAAALGITSRSFSRLCRKLSIETPHARTRRLRQETRQG